MRIKETEQEKIIRYLKRDSLDEVREVYFNTSWTSYKELITYFKKAGWTRAELAKADRPRGRGDERYEKRILYWYLTGKPNYYDPIPDDELKDFEQKIQNNLPTIVTTWHNRLVMMFSLLQYYHLMDFLIHHASFLFSLFFLTTRRPWYVS